MNFKGQTAIETVIVLAFGLLLLSVMSAIVFNELSLQFETQEKRIASDTVNTLAREVDDVYFLGTGSRKEVMVIIPQGINHF